MSIKIFPKPLNKQLSKFSDPIPTNDVLADALNVTETTYFKGSGSSYTGTVPSNNFKYGIFCVVKREANYIVHAISADGTSSNYYNGSAWEGWIVSTKSLNEHIVELDKMSRLDILVSRNSLADNVQATITPVSGKKFTDYDTLIFRIEYGGVYFPVIYKVSFLKAYPANGIRAAIYINSTINGYMEIQSFSDSSIKFLVSAGQSIHYAVFGCGVSIS